MHGLVADRLLPTPMTSYSSRDVETWRAQRPAGNGKTREAVGDLGIVVEQLLPTPTRQDGSNNGGPSQLERNTPPLHAAVFLLPTPSVADVMGGRKSRSGARSDELLLDGLAAAEAFGPYAPAITRWEHVLDREAPAPTEPGKTRPRLASRFVEFLMGLDDGHVTDVGLTRNQELKALGNEVVPAQGAAALRHLHTIRTTYLEEMTS